MYRKKCLDIVIVLIIIPYFRQLARTIDARVLYNVHATHIVHFVYNYNYESTNEIYSHFMLNRKNVKNKHYLSNNHRFQVIVFTLQ